MQAQVGTSFYQIQSKENHSQNDHSDESEKENDGDTEGTLVNHRYKMIILDFILSFQWNIT